MKIIIFLALIVVAFIVLLFAFKKKEKPQDDTYTKRSSDLTTGKPKSETRPSQPTASGYKSIEGQTPKIISTKVIDPKIILGNIEYVEMGKNIYPSRMEQIDEDVRKNLESKIGLIPQIPSNSMRLMNLLLNPESNLKEIVSLVGTHPVFSAKILQTVNSVYFSLPEKITSIGRAITLLGYNNVRALVFHETLHNTMQKQGESDAERHLKIWGHSAMVSACAGFIGKHLFSLSEYDLATSGLLHDIGKFYLINIEDSIEIVSDIPNLIKEEHRYGINHCVAGAYIASHWRLPELIVKGIEYHHNPCFFPPHSIPEGYLKQCFVLCLADLVAKAMGYSGEDEQIMPILPEYFEMFGIDKNLEGIITTELLKNVEKARMTVASYIDTV
ncbi:MAG TPA: HDOD domain-containing protein [Syntrophorhabdaceae bacterium]|nr:HDOD domain-containing protein [Syntrophorhabdaceae bacterium]HPC66486.1 HDOD domain-containing protein [Syntrophorhabdaceae bacterium]HQE79717.1 HDOD domain-containing protein [Syntrophorhabdaceae bacterium]HQH43267.1 HDOD domain-containing protein [Syntrophorhabdaceae bacterium]HRR71472.1 HDOD domain-containing protein [Syntrophorhabdaceae bacterium]